MKLRAYRERLKISFADAAAQIGISESQLSRIETGKSIPKPDTMARIVEWSGKTVQPGDFYDSEEAVK